MQPTMLSSRSLMHRATSVANSRKSSQTQAHGLPRQSYTSYIRFPAGTSRRPDVTGHPHVRLFLQHRANRDQHLGHSQTAPRPRGLACRTRASLAEGEAAPSSSRSRKSAETRRSGNKPSL
eukprot:5585960-Pyramimonas_sp.AAC.1